MNRHPVLLLLILLMFVVSLLLIGCDSGNSPANTSVTSDNPNSIRIVTFAPTLTQMVRDLGFTQNLVGVAEHDVARPSDLPIVGTFFNVDTEKVLSLAPTHVFILTGKDGAPENLVELAEQGHFNLYAYHPYPSTLDDALQILHNDQLGTLAESQSSQTGMFTGSNTPGVGQALGKPELAKQLRGKLQQQLLAIQQLTKDQPSQSVLMLFGLREPVMASGRDTVNNQLLEIAGGHNAAADSAISAPTFDREALIDIAPDTILLLLPNAQPLQPDDTRTAALRSLPIPAAQNGRIHIISDPLILIPGSSMAHTAAVFAETLHPGLKASLRAIVAEPLLPAVSAEQSTFNP
ncbi:ABC transporter substrate-binding protein [Poriferisphaera sp. WC338]|uniref:ABC transporter substrate-binding protein n=1 Tax=Poriferisphaera sp. WC338 TaxID=3425129 RepID=UPI003D81962E